MRGLMIAALFVIAAVVMFLSGSASRVSAVSSVVTAAISLALIAAGLWLMTRKTA